MYQNKYVPPRTIVANNFSFKPPSLPMRLQLSGLAKQVVLFCSMASMKVVCLLCIAQLIPCFDNVVEGGGVPKFLLNTGSWWLKPLYTFCTCHIFEKSSMWNWISLTWGSLGHSFHTVQQSESEIHLSKFVILLNFWKWLCNARTHFCFGYGKLNWVSPPRGPPMAFSLQGFPFISTAKHWIGFLVCSN